MPKEFPGKGVT